jgi:sulfite reductase beta subunit-like hemoprotein
MPAVDDPRTLGRTRLSFADGKDVDEFVATLERYERGELTPDQWRGFRLVRGTYGQRQSGDVQMLRIKAPQGILEGPQLRALADVADAYSRGFGHITTRQNIQFHFLKLHDVEKAMVRLGEAGLTTREACGSAVRNITGCPYAGVAEDEPFDVTPYGEALTRYLLRHPLSARLPRKFKIAFEGCAEDHIFTAINDIGFRARVQGTNGKRRLGFRVTVGGGTAILPTSGGLLFEFLPAGEILDVAEAILRVFARLGDYKHKQRNRMKFLIRELGWDKWRAEFDEVLLEFRAEGGARFPFDPDNPPVEMAPDWQRAAPPLTIETAARAKAAILNGPGIRPDVRPELNVRNESIVSWASTNVRAQKQAGYSVATATVPLGDLTSAQFRVLADLACIYGDGSVRTTADQNLLFRWVKTGLVPAFYRQLAAAGLGRGGVGTIADVTSCPGAEACKLAVTQSRGLGKALSDHLHERPDLVSAAGALSIKISGCPNGCGQHHIAGLGFQGSVRKLGDRAVPQYFVMVGGGVDETGARFGRIAAKVPVRRMTEVLERLIAFYRAERSGNEPASAFFRRVDVERVKALLLDLETLRPEDAVDADFVDLGEDSAFKVETMAGECSA